MTKTGMTRSTTPIAPARKANPIELFVLHSLPDRKKVTFSTFKPAFSAFKQRLSVRGGSAALYAQRRDGWEKLYSTETYPPALSQPYLSADV